MKKESTMDPCSNHKMMPKSEGEMFPDVDYDIVIVGGAFSGGSTALRMKRERPEARVLIIEKSREFDRKVGESCSELAGCFMTRKLNLDDYLARNHIVKHGLRHWFTSEGNECFGRCAEIGAQFQVRLPSYQIDRSTFDQHILDLAVEAGCELWRPANVKSVELGGIGKNQIEADVDGERRTVSAAWVVDASGKASFLPRKLGYHKPLDGHPVNAIWGRFSNVRDLDHYEIKSRFKEYAYAVSSPRSTATNHLVGHGWWCWLIPLKNGDLSAGLVYDERFFTPDKKASLSETLHHHLLTHPVGREMFAGATPIERDTRTYKHVSYSTSKVADAGWLVVGDAAGFIDPLYSQGLDYCCHTVAAAEKILISSLIGNCVKQATMDYNEGYTHSYHCWHQSLYSGKYEYIGDAELMWTAFMLDLSAYFLGPVRHVYEDTDGQFGTLPFHGPIGSFFARLMARYNRRLAVIARKRLAAGVYGAKNLDRRYLIDGFIPRTEVGKKFLKGLAMWAKLEFKTLFLNPDPERYAELEAVALKAPTLSPAVSTPGAKTEAEMPADKEVDETPVDAQSKSVQQPAAAGK